MLGQRPGLRGPLGGGVRAVVEGRGGARGGVQEAPDGWVVQHGGVTLGGLLEKTQEEKGNGQGFRSWGEEENATGGRAASITGSVFPHCPNVTDMLARFPPAPPLRPLLPPTTQASIILPLMIL